MTDILGLNSRSYTKCNLFKGIKGEKLNVVTQSAPATKYQQQPKKRAILQKAEYPFPETH